MDDIGEEKVKVFQIVCVLFFCMKIPSPSPLLDRPLSLSLGRE